MPAPLPNAANTKPFQRGWPRGPVWEGGLAPHACFTGAKIPDGAQRHGSSLRTEKGNLKLKKQVL